MATDWAGTAAAYERSFAHLCEGAVSEILDELPQGCSVLDVGTGPGTVAAAAAVHGHATTGVDADPEMIALARRRHPELRFEVAALPELGGIDGPFGAVVGNFVINHVPAPRAAVRRMGRLAPGGRVVATVWPSEPVSPMNRIWNAVLAAVGADAHVALALTESDFPRTAVGLSSLMQQGGLEDIRTRDVGWVFRIHRDELWRAADGGIARIGAAYRSRDAAGKAAMHMAYLRITDDLAPDGELALPSVALLGVGSGPP